MSLKGCNNGSSAGPFGRLLPPRVLRLTAAVERFHLTGYPSWPSEDLCRQHQAEVERLAQQRDAAILMLEPAMIDRLIQYGQDLVVWTRRHDSPMEPGPPPVFPLASASLSAEEIA